MLIASRLRGDGGLPQCGAECPWLASFITPAQLMSANVFNLRRSPLTLPAPRMLPRPKREPPLSLLCLSSFVGLMQTFALV